MGVQHSLFWARLYAIRSERQTAQIRHVNDEI